MNLADLHLPMATVVEACLEMEIWLSRQVTAESDACRAAQLRESLDPELTKLMDEQLHLVQVRHSSQNKPCQVAAKQASKLT